jgi:hypothetical protein
MLSTAAWLIMPRFFTFSLIAAVHQGCIIFVYLNVQPVNGAGCATRGNTTSSFVTDTSTTFGQMVAATLLTAQTTGQHVQIIGSNACDIVSDTETIMTVYTE